MTLWDATASGRRLRQVPLGLGQVVLGGFDWSPDGRRIVFAAARARGFNPDVPRYTLYTIAIDGSQRQRLRRGAWPAWSHDGRLIAFTGGDFGDGPDSHTVIAVMRRDGTRMTWLSDPTAGYPDEAEYAGDSHPAFSPDDREIVFVREGGRAGWHVVNVAGGDARLMWEPLEYSDYAGPPQWSPDGTLIAGIVNDSETNRYTFVTVPAAGGDPVAAFKFRVRRSPDFRMAVSWRGRRSKVR
jgi:Tol biopolymer transport system component